MLKILNTAQIRDLDAYTIRNQPIASIDLMEQACDAFVQWFADHFDTSKKVGVICGTGNNGGDGLGIARILTDWGFDVKVWIVKGGTSASEDFTSNLDRLKSRIKPEDYSLSADWMDREVLIDAIFGSGLSRPAEGIYAEAIDRINATAAVRVAVDIPSGLMADQRSTGAIVKARYTVTFQLPKLAFFMPENHPFVGEWQLVKIGLDKGFIKRTETPYNFVTRKSVQQIVRPPSRFDHKGDNGKALLIAGGLGKMGAAILSARGALRAGVGLLTVHVPSVGYNIIQTAVPEAMASIDPHDHFFSVPPDFQPYDVVGVGPGIGQAHETVEGLRKVLLSGKRMVLDADALNIISAHKELISMIPKGSILTPHPGEFERLAGHWSDDFERLRKLIDFSNHTGSIVVLKGAFTAIATPSGKVYYNSSGNPGMATGGTGDVLTGILTAMLAQGYESKEAAILGVYLHGLSGDLAAKEKTMHALIASDLADYVPSAFKILIG